MRRGVPSSLCAVLGSGTNSSWIDCVAQTSSTLRAKNLSTTHLVSIGGWNQPHPDTSFSGEQWWAAWKEWNLQAARPELGFSGFDGIDWDVEGVNDQSSGDNVFTLALLKLMGDMSLSARYPSLCLTCVILHNIPSMG